MKTTKKITLVGYDQPDEKLSVRAAKEILRSNAFYCVVMGQNGYKITADESILDGYFDYGCTPLLSEARDLANRKGINQDHSNISFKNDDLAKVKTAVNLHLKNFGRSHNNNYDSTTAQKQEKDAIAAIANTLSFIDGSSQWNGTLTDEHWRPTRILCALSAIDRCRISLMNQLSNIVPKSCLTMAENLIRNNEERIAEYYFKIGCLYRDDWWASHHEGDAIHGKKFDARQHPRTEKATIANKEDKKKREKIIVETAKILGIDNYRAKSSGRLKAKELARTICKREPFKNRVSGVGVEAIAEVIRKNFNCSEKK